MVDIPESGSVIRPPACDTVAHTRHSGSMLLGNCPRIECLLTEYADCGRESHSDDFIEIFDRLCGKRSEDIRAVSSSSRDLFVFIALSRYIGIFSIEPVWLLFGIGFVLFLIVCVRSGCCTDSMLTGGKQ